MSKFQKGQPYSDRLAYARADAVRRAGKDASDADAALRSLALLAKSPEFVAFNVNSPNNQRRLVDFMKREAKA